MFVVGNVVVICDWRNPVNLPVDQRLSKKLRKYALRAVVASLEEYQSLSNSAIPRVVRRASSTVAAVRIDPSERR